MAQLVVQSLLLAAGLTFVLTFQLLPSRYQFNEGDVVTFNIKSPSKVTYTSHLATREERDKAAAAVQEVTEFDVGAAPQQLRKAEDLLRQIYDVRGESGTIEQRQKDLAAIYGLSLSSTAAREALAMDDNAWLVTAGEVKRVLNLVMSERFTADQQADALRRLPFLIDEALPEDRRAVVADIVSGLVRPTVLVDAEATAAAREAARAFVQPIRVPVEKGEIVLRDGDVVRPPDIEKLEAIGLSNPSINWNDILGNALLAVLVAAALASYLHLFQPATATNPRRLALVYAMLLAAVLAAKLVIPGRELWGYLFPVAAVPMLLTILLDVHLAILAIAVLAPVIGMVAGGSLELATASLLAGIAGVLGVWRMERQLTAYMAGLAVAVVTFLTIVVFKSLEQDTEVSHLATIALISLVNGGLSTVLTLGMSSILGHIFGVTTTPGLLELAHPTQPLFRRLLTEAPGTYHHSVIVANLSERAAQQVGADSLLVRVAAYYHDIGKVLRPYCFVENQVDGQNIHDKLNPQMSAKLVAAHAKDGLQLAKQHGLPSKVRDIIEQHHGTRMVKYFYHQACQNGPGSEVVPEDFRYAGPRPQSKEAAIIMLADSVEAAVRSMDDHSTDSITRMVDKLVNDALLEGQLNECDLSMRDLDKIKVAFVSVMQSIFHPRVKYPEPEIAAAPTVAGGEKAALSERISGEPVPERK